MRKVHADTITTLSELKIKSRLEEIGLVVIGSTPETLGSYLKSEITKWGPLIRDANIRINE